MFMVLILDILSVVLKDYVIQKCVLRLVYLSKNVKPLFTIKHQTPLFHEWKHQLASKLFEVIGQAFFYHQIGKNYLLLPFIWAKKN